jgi:hypothetical protein
MSDEQRKDDETEVEGHKFPPSYGADDEQGEEDEVEVEGHVHRRN